MRRLYSLLGVSLNLLLSTFCFAQSVPQQSSFVLMSKSTQAMQTDDSQNPGMLWVKAGEQAWSACTQCHGKAQDSMQGVAAKFPRQVDKKFTNLSQQINRCRVSRLQLPLLASESNEMLQMTAFVGLQSRGLPVRPSDDAMTKAASNRGEQIFNQRLGQLDLSCAQCHTARAGMRLGASVIPQGHPNGYPQYRFEWQTMGSLARRMRNCMVGIRAEPFSVDAPEWLELETFLMRRAIGMTIEIPAVRP